MSVMTMVLEIVIIGGGLGIIAIKGLMSLCAQGVDKVKDTAPVNYMCEVSTNTINVCERAGREYLAKKKAASTNTTVVGSMQDVWNKASGK